MFPFAQLDNKILNRTPDSFGGNVTPIVEPHDVSATLAMMLIGFYGIPDVLHQVTMAVADIAKVGKTGLCDFQASEIPPLDDGLPCSTDRSIASGIFVEKKGF